MLFSAWNEKGRALHLEKGPLTPLQRQAYHSALRHCTALP
jgi:hypothetical protein